MAERVAAQGGNALCCIKELKKNMDGGGRQNQSEVLAEANRLASTGLRHAALDLLLEYAEADAETPQVLAAIGRLYLLERNYRKSVHYLQKSLQVAKATQPLATRIDGYAEDFDNDDLEFVDRQREDSSREVREARYGYEEVAPQLHGMEVKATVEPGDQFPNPAIADSKEPQELPEDDSTEKFGSEPDSANCSGKVEDKDVFDELDILPEEVYGSTDSREQEDERSHESIAEGTGEEELSAQAVAEPGVDDDLLDEDIYFNSTQIEVIDEAFELNWDEIDDLDGYSDKPERRKQEEVVGKGRLTRIARARQAAVDVLDRHDWGKEHLPLLELIFFENGWGAARIAIERELARGTLPEELAVAREIRHFWWQSERYWTTFRGLYSNAMSLQAEATYRQMSWAGAMRIVACFPGLPSIEEVEDLIEEAFLLWYENKRLRRSFPVFLKFLKYRTGSMPGTLSRWDPRCFDEYADDGVGDNLDRFDGDAEELRRQLWEYGVNIDKPREVVSENRLLEQPLEDEE